MTYFTMGGIPEESRKKPLDDWDKALWIYTDTDFRGYRSHARAKEEWTYEWLRGFDENVVFYDIGACVGSYSLMAAARGATVIAFEPLRENTKGLLRNVALNNLEVTVVEKAVSNEPAKMHVHGNQPAGYGLGSLIPDDTKTASVDVETISLDEAAEQWGYPTHIKVDVEGAEVGVFTGAEKTLERVQSIIVEIANDENEKALDDLMASHGLTGVEVGNRRTLDNRTLIYERV